MQAKASTTPGYEAHMVAWGGAIGYSSLLLLLLQGETEVGNKLIRDLPARAEAWLHARFRRWRFLIFGLITFILGAIVAGIVGGESLNLWQTSIQPWLTSSHLVRNWGLVLLSLGWLLFILASLSMWILYGAERRRAGQLETVKQENERNQQLVVQFTSQVTQLTEQVTQLTDRVTQRDTQLAQLAPQLEKSSKETKLLNLLSNTDRELFVLLTQPTISEDEAVNFVEAVFRRAFELWGIDNVYHACIYTPNSNDPNYLTMRWEYGVGSVSRRRNRWYIGAHDPTMSGYQRGLAGTVYVEGKGKVIPDVRTDPIFVDAHQPPRLALPYRSGVQALIHPDDEQKKLGVLCFDSLRYVFTDHDLLLVSQIASRLGWFMQALDRDEGKMQNEL